MPRSTVWSRRLPLNSQSARERRRRESTSRSARQRRERLSQRLQSTLRSRRQAVSARSTKRRQAVLPCAVRRRQRREELWVLRKLRPWKRRPRLTRSTTMPQWRRCSSKCFRTLQVRLRSRSRRLIRLRSSAAAAAMRTACRSLRRMYPLSWASSLSR